MTRLTASALLLLAAACAPAEEDAATTPATETAASAETAAVDVAAEEQRIRELDRQWVAALEGGDAEAVVALYAPDGRMMAPNAEAAEGPDALRQAWSQLLQMPGLSLTFQPTEIEVASNGEMAYDIGTYEMSFDGPDGTIQDEGKYITVWKKVDGQWKVAADMFNTNVPMPQM